MRKGSVAGAVAAAVLAVARADAAAAPALPSTFVSGVSFAMTNDAGRGYDSEAARKSLDALAASGVNAVSVMPFAFQRGPEASTLNWRLTHPASENDAQMTAAVREAKARGLWVLVKPHVWLRGSWPGAIAPADATAWFTEYRAFVVHHAALAARGGADGFCVGTELSLLQGRSEWRDLVAAVRSVFPGVVVYAANWDALEVPFADLLDAVGVDLYAPLSTDPHASDEALAAGARSVVARLEGLGARSRRPVLLTEVGFPARPACWMRPHDERGNGADAEAQRRAAHALLSAVERSTAVRGLFWWKFFSDGESARPDDGSFRVTGRPAAAELFDFFRRFANRAR